MKKPLLWLLTVGAWLVFGGLSACGGSNGNCGKVQPCGGSPVGNWTLSTYCVNGSGMTGNASCPGATADVSGLRQTGTFSFGADMTYQENIMETGTLRVSYPMSCLTSGTVMMTCADLDAQFKALVGQGSSFQAAACSGTSTCTCTLTLAAQTIMKQGTYQTSGTNLSLLANDGTSDGGAYCVQDNNLHLITLGTSMSMGTMGTVTINSDVVLTKG
jgi:hypothetical protein